MDDSRNEWKYVINADNQKELYYCDVCQRPVAALMHRYGTDSYGERYEQFRVSCQVCQTNGKVYLNKTVAILSWSGGEHNKPPEPFPVRPKRRREVIRYDE